MGQGYLKGGWKHKYVIRKANGKPLDPKAKYFVLRYDAPEGDPNARAAMRAYAVNVQRVNPKLAADILDRVAREDEKLVCRKCLGTGNDRRSNAETPTGFAKCSACGGTGKRRFKTATKEGK